MGRYLPGAILTVFGILVYVIGCMLFVAHRRQRAQEARKAQGAPSKAAPSKSLFVYAIVMMVLGIAALGGGLATLETAEYHALGQ
jgi:cell division protein FtsX